MSQPPLPPFLRTLSEHDPQFAETVANIRQQAVLTAGALDVKTKLLIAFALDAAHGIEDGARTLAQRARDNGATEAELLEVVRVLYSLGGMQNLSVAVRALNLSAHS
ncbi:MAG: carboxymuconolactone decarboxylase family protein [Chloroflexi bacterium]|nr:carboxymuconolactone decarboxylase family protein [Chloroflexota bacterium]